MPIARRLVVHPITTLLVVCAGLPVRAADAPQAPPPPSVRFNTHFEGASLGKVEAIGPDAFRLSVPGQYNENGRNRQTSWFSFRVDGGRGRALTLTLTDLIGEYDLRPGAVPYGPGIVPVFSSDDGKTWAHFDDAAVTWDETAKEMTLRFTPAADRVYVAHIQPYTPTDLRRLLDDVERSPHAVVEVIGRTLQGRELHQVTVTDAAVPPSEKKCVWLQARQHAWEAGTSYVMDGALRFAVSEEPAAAQLRKRLVMRFTPMVDVDGAADGGVRFNGNGFDVNRHWSEVDLVSKERLREMPEIWYTKRAIVSAHALGPPIELLVNLHNTETNEYLAAFVDDDTAYAKLSKLESILMERSQFDPSSRLSKPRPSVIKGPQDTTNSLWRERKIPAALMEMRIAPGQKMGRRPTAEDRVKYGRELIEAMGEAAD